MKKRKPLIGVTTSARKGHLMWWCIHLGIRLVGGRAVRITALSDDNYQKCDGYVISGGSDIDPKCYGQENTASIDIEPERDTLETHVITHALEHKKPLFGICRGAQMINVVKGGTLHQNALDFYENFVPSDSMLGKIFSRRQISITKDSILFNLLNKRTTLYVNSLHHQAVNELGESLHITAKDTHGIPQAIEEVKKGESFILGVQWHPEFLLYRKAQRTLFRALVQHTKR